MESHKECSLCVLGRKIHSNNDSYLCHTCKQRRIKFLDIPYSPNKIPFSERLVNKILSVLLLLYGSYGVYVNDLYISGKRTSGIHLHDESAIIMYGAFICGILVLLSVVIDHYDKRDNEHTYQIFAQVFKYLGWGLFGASLVWRIVN